MRSRAGKLTQKTRPQFGSQAATHLHKAEISSNPAVNTFPSLIPIARHTVGAGHARSRYLNRKEEDAEGRASDWSEVITRYSYWKVQLDHLLFIES